MDTLTWDLGPGTWERRWQITDHKEFTVATDVAVYFCDPKSPLQRGSNENTNRLLRQYLPKGTDSQRTANTISMRSRGSSTADPVRPSATAPRLIHTLAATVALTD